MSGLTVKGKVIDLLDKMRLAAKAQTLYEKEGLSLGVNRADAMSEEIASIYEEVEDFFDKGGFPDLGTIRVNNVVLNPSTITKFGIDKLIAEGEARIGKFEPLGDTRQLGVINPADYKPGDLGFVTVKSTRTREVEYSNTFTVDEVDEVQRRVWYTAGGFDYFSDDPGQKYTWLLLEKGEDSVSDG